DFGMPVELGLWKEMAFMRLVGALNGADEHILELNHNQRYLLVVMMREFFAGVNTLRDQARRSLTAQEQLMCQVDNQKVVFGHL
ncbi:MAG: coproporphyrinogen dehydrogenase, partial [Anaerolineaceae bacterium]|nr:coproporphyrinogen dehydrogenase [Anaerolineaceae bacterium]